MPKCITLKVFKLQKRRSKKHCSKTTTACFAYFSVLRTHCASHVMQIVVAYEKYLLILNLMPSASLKKRTGTCLWLYCIICYFNDIVSVGKLSRPAFTNQSLLLLSHTVAEFALFFRPSLIKMSEWRHVLLQNLHISTQCKLYPVCAMHLRYHHRFWTS